VIYNLTIHVPRNTELRLRTVNGEVKTEQTNGSSMSMGVQWSIKMTAIAPALDRSDGERSNGRFIPPESECGKRFPDVNGPSTLRFRPVSQRTFASRLERPGVHRFRIDSCTRAASAGEREGGRFVYKANHFSSVRVARRSGVEFEDRQR